jgi:hypothetical protein
VSKYFVYIASMSGPEPQKWSDTMTVSGKPIPTLAKYEITDIEWVYSVDFLKGLYPYEAKE